MCDVPTFERGSKVRTVSSSNIAYQQPDISTLVAGPVFGIVTTTTSDHVLLCLVSAIDIETRFGTATTGYIIEEAVRSSGVLTTNTNIYTG